eukprot:3666526-Prymnesium_polylepis.1
MRTAIEIHTAAVKHSPMVQLVVNGARFTVHHVLSAAYEGIPIVIMAGSGGAAEAICVYCQDGISAVAVEYQEEEPALRLIKQMNMHYEGKLLNFFELGDVEGVDTGTEDGTQLADLVYEAIIGMVGARPIWDLIPVGETVKHLSLGVGTIETVHKGGARTIAFENNPDPRGVMPFVEVVPREEMYKVKAATALTHGPPCTP